VDDVRQPAELQIDHANDPDAGSTRRTRRRVEATHADLERLARGELESVLLAARYRVERLLGRGGMASVHAAHDLLTDRPVALKILSEDCCSRPPLLARFLREARLHGRIHHRNVVEILDFGSTDTGLIYLAMELLEGEDLGRTLARRSMLPWPRVRELMLEICAGLAAVHAAGVVHRDLKPSNCFKVTGDGCESIRLVDFGIAAAIDEARTARLTLNDQILGTPEYMSPEQARSEPVDHRSDIYSAGLLLGELLTGSLPFRAATSPAMLAAQIYEPPPKLRSLLPPNVHIPAALEPVYERALAKDPDRRFANVEEFAAALRAIEPGGPLLVSGAHERSQATSPAPTSRRRTWLAVSIALVIAAVSALALASGLN
jgi:serine/threonine protein kinase